MTAHAIVMQNMRTGRPELDRHAPRLAAEALLAFGHEALRPELGRALMAIVNNESRGAGAPVIGDADLGGGPSIGPMQVYRSTAKKLGLWTPPAGATLAQERAAYASLAHDEALGLRWGVQVFKLESLPESGGDIRTAIRRYNAATPEKGAPYLARALEFYAATWGPFPSLSRGVA